MTRLALLCAVLLSAVPASARALLPAVELSVGSGGSSIDSEVSRDRTNLMLAPGLKLVPMVALHVGLLTRPVLERGERFDLDVRPMLTVKPPLFPLYLRGIVSIPTVLEGTTRVDAGGAVGARFGLFGVGVFAEVGYLANVRTYGAATIAPDWTIDGRVGVAIE